MPAPAAIRRLARAATHLPRLASARSSARAIAAAAQPNDQRAPFSWSWGCGGLGAAAAAAYGAGLARPASCENADAKDGFDIKLTTYNVLAPKLCNKKHFPFCVEGACDEEARWAKVRGKIEEEIADGAVLGLQEVDLKWCGRLHALFAERGYVAVFAQYGKQFNNYMGVMIAWPRDKYEAVDVEIARVSDTAPPDTWPKNANWTSGLNPYGFLTWNGLKKVIGCPPPEAKSDTFEWDLAHSRFNEAVFARLRPRDGKGRSFVVSTYHMPCIYGPPENVRVVNIHCYLLLAKLRQFAGDDPAVLMGDFNIKPDGSPYVLISSGGSFDEAARVHAEELKGLKERIPGNPPWPQGLRSAYRDFHNEEPLFTNFAQAYCHTEPFVETLDYIWHSGGLLRVVECPRLPQTKAEAKGPFPNAIEPSDHIAVKATLRMQS